MSRMGPHIDQKLEIDGNGPLAVRDGTLCLGYYLSWLPLELIPQPLKVLPWWTGFIIIRFPSFRARKRSPQQLAANKFERRGRCEVHADSLDARFHSERGAGKRRMTDLDLESGDLRRWHANRSRITFFGNLVYKERNAVDYRDPRFLVVVEKLRR